VRCHRVNRKALDKTQSRSIDGTVSEPDRAKIAHKPALPSTNLTRRQISRGWYATRFAQLLDAITGDAFILIRQRALFFLADDIVEVAERPSLSTIGCRRR
jgi:hypothetical protein